MMRGATLVELLVALLLAGLAVSGSLSVLAHAQRTGHDAERLGRLHERAQYVFATLEPELQMAGYPGAGKHAEIGNPAALVRASASCGASTVLPLQPAVRVMTGNWQLPCPAQGQGAMTDSDVLVLWRASTRIANSADGALQLASDTSPRQLRDLLVRIYYVARAADGDPRTSALRVKSLTAVAGAPAFVDTEVMPGVEELQIALLPDAMAPRSVRVRLRVCADAADVRAGEALPSLTLERRFNLRNAIP